VTGVPIVARLRPRLGGYLVPIAAVVAALLIGAIILLRLGADPIEGFAELFSGAFGSTDALIGTALKATPLLLVGVGITIAFRANVINIGGEGQMVAGGLLATTTALVLPDVPTIVALPAVLLAGIVGGAIWGAIPGALKAYYGVNEILSTIMLNVVAVQLMNFLLRGALIDPAEIERGTRIPQTKRLMESADLPSLFGSDRLHIGPLIAVLAAVGAYVLMWRTPLGFRIRSVGLNPSKARSRSKPPCSRMCLVGLPIQPDSWLGSCWQSALWRWAPRSLWACEGGTTPNRPRNPPHDDEEGYEFRALFGLETLRMVDLLVGVCRPRGPCVT